MSRSWAIVTAALRRSSIFRPQGEGAEQGVVGLGHARVEPGVPGVVEDALAGDLGRHLEAGVEAGLERALLEEGLGEGVDGRDGRALEVGGGGPQALALFSAFGLLDRLLDARRAGGASARPPPSR